LKKNELVSIFLISKNEYDKYLINIKDLAEKLFPFISFFIPYCIECKKEQMIYGKIDLLRREFEDRYLVYSSVKNENKNKVVYNCISLQMNQESHITTQYLGNIIIRWLSCFSFNVLRSCKTEVLLCCLFSLFFVIS
jgi:hypothetical protein